MDRERLLSELEDEDVTVLYRLLTRLKTRFRDHLKADLQRSLPLADELFDRWERARYLGFGEGSSIYDCSLVLGKVQVGAHTWIGPSTVLDGSGGLTIGSYCSISAGVQIYSHDSVQWAVSGGVAPYEYAATTVGDRCYLGPNVTVARGVTLGAGCVVGAHSFVNRSFPDGAKIAGCPARALS